MGAITSFIERVRNSVINATGVSRSLDELIDKGDISKAIDLFEDHSNEVEEAIREYNPETHDVMFRRDKIRRKGTPYIVEKLPRSWQRYINEVALFFLLGNPIKWSMNDINLYGEAFNAFKEFLSETRFNATMRSAKRLAGAETESAKLYHIYRDDTTFTPKVKVVILARSLGYSLHPLFDQYRNLVAFGYGYCMNENGKSVRHFDIQTSQRLVYCTKTTIGWKVTTEPNPTGKINVIYYSQEKEWAGSEVRINRDEMIDSKTADTNNYFADPIAAATTDVIESLPDPDLVGKMIRLSDGDSIFKYIEPPTSPQMKESEKKVLRESILQDTFTPDLSYENMKGLGTLSGEAMRRAMIVGYMKRDNRKEIYDELVDREKNLILAIMSNITHVGLRSQLEAMKITHEFAEPFNDDVEAKWASVGKAYTDGIISLNEAVQLVSVAKDPEEEIARIKADHQPIQPLEGGLATITDPQVLQGQESE